tara:strand:- start:4742 stop:4936 length:195 start_codon:yes stop_codon:yes gene_type:complete
MDEVEFNKLMKLPKMDLVMEIWRLQQRIDQLEERNSAQRWRLSPDRMGGGFSDGQSNRRGDEFS